MIHHVALLVYPREGGLEPSGRWHTHTSLPTFTKKYCRCSGGFGFGRVGSLWTGSLGCPEYSPRPRVVGLDQISVKCVLCRVLGRVVRGEGIHCRGMGQIIIQEGCISREEHCLVLVVTLSSSCPKVSMKCRSGLCRKNFVFDRNTRRSHGLPQTQFALWRLQHCLILIASHFAANMSTQSQQRERPTSIRWAENPGAGPEPTSDAEEAAAEQDEQTYAIEDSSDAVGDRPNSDAAFRQAQMLYRRRLQQSGGRSKLFYPNDI